MDSLVWVFYPQSNWHQIILPFWLCLKYSIQKLSKEPSIFVQQNKTRLFSLLTLLCEATSLNMTIMRVLDLSSSFVPVKTISQPGRLARFYFRDQRAETDDRKEIHPLCSHWGDSASGDLHAAKVLTMAPLLVGGRQRGTGSDDLGRQKRSDGE